MSKDQPDFRPVNRIAYYLQDLKLPPTPEYDWLDAAISEMDDSFRSIIARVAQERIMQRQREGELGDLFIAQGGLKDHRKMQK